MQNTYPGSHKGVKFVIITQKTTWGSWTAEAEISYPAERQTITVLTVLSHSELEVKLHVDETEAIESARRDACAWIERELARPTRRGMDKRTCHESIRSAFNETPN